MRTLLVFALVLAAASVSMAFMVCPPDACARVHCPMDQGEAMCLAKGAPGQYRYFQHGGFCGCCHECVKLMQVNESCLNLLGTPHRHICADGLKCDSATHKCVKA